MRTPIEIKNYKNIGSIFILTSKKIRSGVLEFCSCHMHAHHPYFGILTYATGKTQEESRKLLFNELDKMYE